MKRIVISVLLAISLLLSTCLVNAQTTKLRIPQYAQIKNSVIPPIESWQFKKRGELFFGYKLKLFKLIPVTGTKKVVTFGEILTFKDPATKQKGLIFTNAEGIPVFKVWGKKGQEFAAIRIRTQRVETDGTVSDTEDIWRSGSYALVTAEYMRDPLRYKITLTDSDLGFRFSVELPGKCLDSRIVHFCESVQL
ncbi:MAG: hypothetical protein AAB897_01690 [Patescibacteria group bacterium]